MSRIRADRLTDKAGTGAPLFPNGISVVGLTSLSNVVAGIATFTSDVSVGGTLTYEDVTNIDSVGIVTARTGVRVTAGGIVVTAGVSTLAAVSATSYSGDGSGLTGMASTDKVSTATLNVSGISTFASQVSGITAMGANAVDCSTANYFTKTITGATTFTFTNVPTGVAYGMTMEVTLNGSNAITWPAAVKWPADTAPTITDGKTQLFMFVTDDGGTRWRGSSLVDYTN
tara:strand:- start:61 stop:747 length:687 start_codon:yes stop_codon:yes gene_type:complete